MVENRPWFEFANAGEECPMSDNGTGSALGKALAVLEVLLDEPAALSLGDIAARTDLFDGDVCFKPDQRITPGWLTFASSPCTGIAVMVFHGLSLGVIFVTRKPTMSAGCRISA